MNFLIIFSKREIIFSPLFENHFMLASIYLQVFQTSFNQLSKPVTETPTNLLIVLFVYLLDFIRCLHI